MIDVQKLIDSTMMKGVSLWRGYDGIPGFEVNLAYVSKQHMIQIFETCSVRTWDKETRAFIEKADRGKVAQHWADKIVIGWKGLTLSKFQRLFPIDVPVGQEDLEVPPTLENRIALLWNSSDFENWCLAVATSPDNFVDVRKKAETEIAQLG
jgi:hypothetical protein